MRVLVVDDDAMLRHWVAKVLREEGHDVDTADNAMRAQSLALSLDYDALIVDLDLPDGSGLSIVQELRRAGKTMPILIFAGRGDDDAVVAGLNAGADDYLIKPAGTDVLRARVRAALRRGGAVNLEQLTVGALTMDRMQRTVSASGKQVTLTPKEFRLLEYFMLRPERIVPRTELLEHVWGVRFDTYTSVVDTTVSRFRQRLSAVCSSPQLRTVRGTGYVLTEKKEPSA